MTLDKWLSKTYKGRYIEHLEQFLVTLDKEYCWINYHFNFKFKLSKLKPKYFFCFYCPTTKSLILTTVHKVQHSTIGIIDVAYGEQLYKITNDKTFIVDAVYSKSVSIQQPDFDSIAEHFDFLFK